MDIPKQRPAAIMPLDVFFEDPRPFYSEYEQPFYLYAQHRAERGERKAVYGACTGGFLDTQDESKADEPGGDRCVFCKLSTGQKNISRRVLGAWPYVHLAWYHLIQAHDNDGKPIVYERGDRAGQPYMVREECEGNKCQHCRDKAEEVFGATRYSTLGPAFRTNLGDHNARLASACANCRKGLIEPVALICPQCEASIIDLEGMADEQIEKLSYSFLTCTNCGHKDIPRREAECTHCADPRPTEFNDVVLYLIKEGERAQTTIQMRHPKNPNAVGWCYRDEFEVDFGDGEMGSICEMIDGEYDYEDDIKALMKPFDFDNMLGVSAKLESVDNQCKRLGVENPYIQDRDEPRGGEPGDDEDVEPRRGRGGRFSGRRGRSRSRAEY
jgi:hypothetical protein